MTYQEIKADAPKYSGQEFSAESFKFCFPGHGMKTLNRLVAEGVFVIGNPYPNKGRPLTRYIVA